MKAYVCKVCGYIHFGEEAPEKCPQCGASKDKFELKEDNGDKNYADEHKIGVAQGLDEEGVKGLRDNFMGECTEVSISRYKEKLNVKSRSRAWSMYG